MWLLYLYTWYDFFKFVSKLVVTSLSTWIESLLVSLFLPVLIASISKKILYAISSRCNKTWHIHVQAGSLSRSCVISYCAMLPVQFQLCSDLKVLFLGSWLFVDKIFMKIELVMH